MSVSVSVATESWIDPKGIKHTFAPADAAADTDAIPVYCAPFLLSCTMGPRILSILSGVITALFAVLFVIVRMMNGWAELLDFLFLGILFIASSVVTLLVLRKKLDYMGYPMTFALLFSSTIFCALIYAAVYGHLDAFFLEHSQHFTPPFFGLFITQVLVRLPIDLVTAIFYKRDT